MSIIERQEELLALALGRAGVAESCPSAQLGAARPRCNGYMVCFGVGCLALVARLGRASRAVEAAGRRRRGFCQYDCRWTRQGSRLELLRREEAGEIAGCLLGGGPNCTRML